MAEIINLKQYRKKRERAEKEAKASENRRRFGRSKAEKLEDNLQRERQSEELDGKKLDDNPPKTEA